MAGRVQREIPIVLLDVDPANPRTDPGDVTDLAASIAGLGVLEPLLVRPSDGGRWLVVAGRRRWTAAAQAGLSSVPCVIAHLDDDQAAIASAAENLARRDLDPITEAETYRRLADRTGWSHARLAATLGVPASTLAGRIRLLDLPEDVREEVRAGEMTLGAAQALLRKSEQARRQTSRRRPSRFGVEDVDVLDVVAVDADLVRAVRRHLADHVQGETITDLIARAVRRELHRPSCHVDGCWDDAYGGGRWCRRHYDQARAAARRAPGAVR